MFATFLKRDKEVAQLGFQNLRDHISRLHHLLYPHPTLPWIPAQKNTGMTHKGKHVSRDSLIDSKSKNMLNPFGTNMVNSQ